MKLTYDEYVVDENRVQLLRVLGEQFLEALEEDLKQYANDPLCTTSAIHVTGTEEQLHLSAVVDPVQEKATLSRVRPAAEEERCRTVQISDHSDPLQP